MNRHSSSPSRLRLEALEERCTPSTFSNLFNAHDLGGDFSPPKSGLVRSDSDHGSQGAEHQLPYNETLTVVSVTGSGIYTYVGDATYFGQLTAVSFPNNTFVKTAANGDAAFGTITPSSATAGTLQFTGGTGQFADIRGTESYVISTDPTTKATTVTIVGSVSFDSKGHNGEPGEAEAAHQGQPHSVPFLVTGGGTAPDGLPVFPGGTAPFNAAGWSSLTGKYSGNDGSFTLLSFDPTTGTGTFTGSYVFVAANGDKLAFKFGADPNNPGTFTLIPVGNGEVEAVFVAVFTPDPANSTGGFKDVTGGSFTMVATSAPFVPLPNAQGFTPPFAYTWVGEGILEIRNEKK